MTAQTLDSASFFKRLHFYLALPTHNFFYFFYGSFIPFLPPPRPTTYCPPSFNCQRCLYLYLHPLIPLHLAWARSDRPTGRRPGLPASTARMRFPTLLGIPMISSHEPVSAFPRPVAPPFPSSTYVIMSLSSLGFYRPGVPSSLCLPPPSARPLPPPDGLN